MKTSAARAGLSKSEDIAAEIESDIVSGRLPNGTRLDSENALVARFSASRNTVRKGLEDLASRGLIVTRNGIGSFVTFSGQTIDSQLGWSRALERVGSGTETEILQLAVLSDGALAESLGLESNEFLALDRVRRLTDSGQAISLERSRVPLVPELRDLPLRGLIENSLNSSLAAVGLYPNHGEEWAEVSELGTADARILGRRRGASYLRLRRLSRTADERIMEHVVSLLDPRYFGLHLSFGPP